MADEMDLGIRILVVEDLVTTQLLLRKALKRIGFREFVIVKNGRDALEEMKHSDFHLVITDWIMPEMNGLEFFKAYRKREFSRKIPFLMITVQQEKYQVLQALEMGFDQYIVKPVTPKVLEQKIRAIFHKT